MKITKAWKNRQKVIDACKEASACKDELRRLIGAENQQDFEEVLYNNFSWCVKNGILECWMSDVVYCKELDCHNNNLISLPELPQLQELYCRHNNLTSLPDMPRVQELYCSYNNLASLPDMPRVEKLYCSHNNLASLPDMPRVEKLYCDKGLKK